MTTPADRRRPAHRGLRSPVVGSLRFRAGAPVEVLEITADGALIETDRHLGPGAAIEMVLSLSSGPVPLRVRVAHARLWRLVAGARPRYRLGLSFEPVPALLTDPPCVGHTRAPNSAPDRAGVYPACPGPAGGPVAPGRHFRVAPRLVRGLERPTA